MVMFVILYHLAFLLLTAVEGSNVGTFQDGTCSKSLDNYNGPNGYPDGTCTPLHVESGRSFSVVGLDSGCQVTIYGNNSDPSMPCSSEIKIVAQLAQCYNSSWVYYSIDGCDIPSTLPTSSALSEATASATSTPSAAVRPSTGVIVGGIVGGVSAFGLVFVFAMYFLRRHYRSHRPPPPPLHELSEDRALGELPPKYPEKVANIELYAHDVAELGRQSVYVEPVELPDNVATNTDKKEVNPLIQVHYV